MIESVQGLLGWYVDTGWRWLVLAMLTAWISTIWFARWPEE